MVVRAPPQKKFVEKKRTVVEIQRQERIRQEEIFTKILTDNPNASRRELRKLLLLAGLNPLQINILFLSEKVRIKDERAKQREQAIKEQEARDLALLKERRYLDARELVRKLVEKKPQNLEEEFSKLVSDLGLDFETIKKLIAEFGIRKKSQQQELPFVKERIPEKPFFKKLSSEEELIRLTLILFKKYNLQSATIRRLLLTRGVNVTLLSIEMVRAVLRNNGVIPSKGLQLRLDEDTYNKLKEELNNALDNPHKPNILIPSEEPKIGSFSLDLLYENRHKGLREIEDLLLENNIHLPRESIFYWLEKILILEKEGFWTPLIFRNVSEFYSEVKEPLDRNDQLGSFRKLVMVKFLTKCGGSFFGTTGLKTRKRGVDALELIKECVIAWEKEEPFVRLVINELIELGVLKYSETTKRFLILDYRE